MSRPGPRREVTLADDERARLLTAARGAGVDVERARQQMLRHAERRQSLILQLHTSGLSVRELARELGVSAGVVQGAIAAARGRGDESSVAAASAPAVPTTRPSS